MDEEKRKRRIDSQRIVEIFRYRQGSAGDEMRPLNLTQRPNCRRESSSRAACPASDGLSPDATDTEATVARSHRAAPSSACRIDCKLRKRKLSSSAVTCGPLRTSIEKSNPTEVASGERNASIPRRSRQARIGDIATRPPIVFRQGDLCSMRKRA